MPANQAFSSVRGLPLYEAGAQPKTHGDPVRRHLHAKHIAILLVIVSALPVLSLAFWQTHRLERTLRDSAESSVVIAANDVAHDITVLMRFRVEELEILALRAAHLETWDQNSALRGVLDGRYGWAGFSILFLTDRYGTSILASPETDAKGQSHAGINYADRAYMRRVFASKHPAIGDAMMGRRMQNASIAAAAPVLARDGTLRGVVTGGIRLDPIEDVAAATSRSGVFRIVLTDERDAVILDTARRARPLSQWPLSSDTARPAYVTDEEDTQVLIASTRLQLPGTTWGVHVLAPEAALLASARSLQRATLWATALTVFILAVLTFAIVTATSRDLRRVAIAARSVGKGAAADEYEPSAWAPREVVDVRHALGDAIRELAVQSTQRTALIRELEEKNERLRTLAAAVSDARDGVVVLDRGYHVLYANAAGLRLAALSAEDVFGKRLDQLDLRAEELPAQLQAAFEQGNPWEGLVELRQRDGSTLALELAISPVLAEDGSSDRVVALVRDVTARRQAELSMQQTERLASLGLLAAGVAHEINNPMTYVLGYLEELRDLTTEGSLTIASSAGLDLAGTLDDCLHGARRVVQIVGDLRQLSRLRRDSNGPEGKALAADGREAIEVCLRLAQSQLRHCNDVVRVLPDQELWLAISPQHLGQVLLNLVVNAGQSMNQRRPARLTVTLREVDDERAEILVADTGCGIPRDTLRRIFDPFFTTKGAGVGTGLGLSICRSLVAAAGGTIVADSTVGEGTVFRVVLPKTRPPSATTNDSVVSLSGISLLIIDDDPSVLASVRRIFAACKTSATTSVNEALQLIERDHFDLVLCDVMMGELGGVELALTLRRLESPLAQRLCLMTGGVLDEQLSAQLESLGIPMLHKPLDRQEVHLALGRVLRAALRATRPQPLNHPASLAT